MGLYGALVEVLSEAKVIEFLVPKLCIPVQEPQEIIQYQKLPPLPPRKDIKELHQNVKEAHYSHILELMIVLFLADLKRNKDP